MDTAKKNNIYRSATMFFVMMMFFVSSSSKYGELSCAIIPAIVFCSYKALSYEHSIKPNETNKRLWLMMGFVLLISLGGLFYFLRK